MAKSSTGYTRLTRNTASYGTYSCLWLGSDHLIIVRSTGYQETYARLQLSEVKGIFLTGSKRRIGWAIPWGIIIGISMVTMVFTLFEKQTPYISGFFIGVGLVGLLWNHLLGAGCRAHVVTGVQTAELPALVRVKKARRVIAQLQPVVNTIQANLVVPPPIVAPDPPVVPMESSSLPPTSAAVAEPAFPPPDLRPPAAG